MDVTSLIFFTFALLMLLSPGCPKRNESLLCYQCDENANLNGDSVLNCPNVATCAEEEVCYTEVHLRLSGDRGQEMVRAGCKSKLDCIKASGPAVGVGRRSDQIMCADCCDSNFCNDQLCDRKALPKVTSCSACKDLQPHEHCGATTLCIYPDICAVEKWWTHGNVVTQTYTCAPRNLCGDEDQIGKRFLNFHFICRDCCDTEMCNYNLTCKPHHN